MHCILHVSTWLRDQYYFGNFMPFSRKIPNLGKETSVQFNAIVVKSPVVFMMLLDSVCSEKIAYRPSPTLAASKSCFHLSTFMLKIYILHFFDSLNLWKNTASQLFLTKFQCRKCMVIHWNDEKADWRAFLHGFQRKLLMLSDQASIKSTYFRTESVSI